MTRMAALIGALLMTLVLAAPATANQKVWIKEFSGDYGFEVPVSIADGWDFACSKPVYYGSYGEDDLWLWYKNGVTDLKPEGVAWPWIKGQYVHKGVDYFSSKPGMTGMVVSGKFKTTTHQYDHHLGTPGDPNDLESWTQTTTGKNWGIQIPGYGTVFHESGNYQEIATVVDQVPGAFDPIEYVPIPPFHGNQTFELDQLCAFFGADLVLP